MRLEEASCPRPMGAIFWISPFDGSIKRGERLKGFEDCDFLVDTVELRDRAGLPFEAKYVDKMVASRVEAHLATGRDVLLHVLDCSKTGLSGPTRAMAADIAASHPGRVMVVVDACQLRCEPQQIRCRPRRLAFAVMLTGFEIWRWASVFRRLAVAGRTFRAAEPNFLALRPFGAFCGVGLAGAAAHARRWIVRG